MREIVFDTETTGLDPDSGHRVVEIGCVELIDRRKTGAHCHLYINPERDMPSAAERVHGLSEVFLSTKPVFKDVAQEFVDFVGKSKLVIHNASFDMKFINFELRRVNLKPIPYERAIDTLPLARKKFPGAKASLDALCQRFGISLEKREKHGALLDSELLADVYLELLGGAQNTLLFDKKNSSVGGSAQPRPEFKHVTTPELTPLHEEEVARHKAFLASFKEPMWCK